MPSIYKLILELNTNVTSEQADFIVEEFNCSSDFDNCYIVTEQNNNFIGSAILFLLFFTPMIVFKK